MIQEIKNSKEENDAINSLQGAVGQYIHSPHRYGQAGVFKVSVWRTGGNGFDGSYKNKVHMAIFREADKKVIFQDAVQYGINSNVPDLPRACDLLGNAFLNYTVWFFIKKMADADDLVHAVSMAVYQNDQKQ